MITTRYVESLYTYAYGVVNLAEQDNIRSTFCDYIDYVIGADVLVEDIGRAIWSSTVYRKLANI